MKKIIFTIICACLFFSCATDKNIVQQEITEKKEVDSTEVLFLQLQQIVYNDDIKSLTSLVDTTPPVQMRNAINQKCPDGKTLLHKAVLAENAQIVEKLILAGADKSVVDNNHKTPADYAKDARNSNIRKLFGFAEVAEKQKETEVIVKKEPATINEESASKSQNFHDSYKVVFGATDSKFLNAIKEQDYATVSKLLKSGQNVNEVDMLGNNGLFYAIDSQNGAILNLLISYNINCNRQNKQGQIPFLFVVDTGNISEISALLKAGASINKGDITGLTAAGIAVAKKNASLLKYLVSNGATLHGKDSNENTLLHIAIMNEDISTTRFLLEQDCDVYIPNNKGVKPVDLLRQSKRIELQKLAKDYE